ncbi:hypothetical protein CL684_01280 [Candidatus Campbellbacteria bacterium]|nr:hypothetical protein [Candidatus Campbellbacteria bacterium]|tara:strand:+ start:286 stop:603 length:318 start_codon:yes stop_codon:yes gene_type:complete
MEQHPPIELKPAQIEYLSSVKLGKRPLKLQILQPINILGFPNGGWKDKEHYCLNIGTALFAKIGNNRARIISEQEENNFDVDIPWNSFLEIKNNLVPLDVHKITE